MIYILSIIFHFYFEFHFYLVCSSKYYCVFDKAETITTITTSKSSFFSFSLIQISYQWFLISICCYRHVLSIRHSYPMSQIWMHDFGCLSLYERRKKDSKNEKKKKRKWKYVLLRQVMHMVNEILAWHTDISQNPKYSIIIFFIQIWYTMEGVSLAGIAFKMVVFIFICFTIHILSHR